MDFYIDVGYVAAGELHVPKDQVFLSKLIGIVALRKMAKNGIQTRFSSYDDDESKSDDHSSWFCPCVTYSLLWFFHFSGKSLACIPF